MKQLNNKIISLAYFGTPEFSARFLEKLLTDKQLPIEIKLVVTQPDKPVGRKQILTPSPVKVTAKNYSIKTYEIIPAKTADYRKLAHLLYELKIDAGIVYGYGGLIPACILQSVRTALNIHPSFLPKYRGPSPIPYSLILNDVETGMTIIKMDEKIDHGPIIIQEKIKILLTDKKPNLEIKLTNLAFAMFKKVIKKLVISNLEEIPLKKQDEKQATYTRRLKKDDGFIPLQTLKKALNNERLSFDELPKLIKEYYLKNPNLLACAGRFRNSKLEIRNSAKIIENYFRGLYPWPGIWTNVEINGREKRLKIIDIDLVGDVNLCSSNTVEKKHACSLQMKKVQLEGKKEVDFETFNQAYKLFKL